MNRLPYPGYESFGVPWLGDIPAHWQIKRLKNIVTLNPESLPETTDPDYTLKYLDISNVDEVEGARPPEEMRFENAPSRARRIVRTGDTILSTVRTYLKAIAYFENPPDNLIVSTGFAVLRPCAEVLPKFLYALVRCPQFVEMVVAHSVGVGYPAINPSELSSLPVWLPPLKDQSAIAAFLDRETAKLDALIAKNERLIELLKEKRAALIRVAVTRGLDPNAPLKDSGVPWFGEMPKHWEIVALRRVIDKFVDYRGHTPPKVVSGIHLVTARNVKNGFLDFGESQEFIPEDLYNEWMVRGLPEVGDVIVTTEAPLGNVAQIVDPGVALAQRLILLKADSTRVVNSYLKYYFLAAAGQSELQRQATGSTAEGIKASKFKAITVCVPRLDEQRAIAAYLDRETAELEALIAKVREGIDKLREYRAALIAAAVTGKIDVRSHIRSMEDAL